MLEHPGRFPCPAQAPVLALIFIPLPRATESPGEAYFDSPVLVRLAHTAAEDGGGSG